MEDKAEVSIKVYDLRGNQVADVFNGILGQGKYKTEIDIRKFVSGIYHARLSVGGKNYVRKFIVRHS